MIDIKLRYPMIAESDVSPKIMLAILFRKTIPLTEEIMNLIQDSLPTNSLDVITENTKVIPTTNIMSAYIYGNYAKQPYMYLEILSSMSDELLDMFGARENETVADVGNYLEVISAGVMNLRLMTSYEVACEEGTSITFTLRDLLQLEKFLVGTSQNLKDLLALQLSISPTSRAPNIKLPLRSSRTTTASNQPGYEKSKLLHQSMFFADMNVKEWKDGRAVELIPSKGECFDAGWLLPQSGAPTKPFALLLECTSRDINITRASRARDRLRDFGYADLPGDGTKAEYFINTVAVAQTEVDAGNIALTPGSVLEALVEGRYLYVYLDTSDECGSIAVGDNILLMRSTDSKRYLSFYYDFFRLLREGAIPGEAGLA
eukprot:gene36778-biopygen26573